MFGCRLAWSGEFRVVSILNGDTDTEWLFSLLDTFHLVFSMYLVYSFILQALGSTQAAASVLWCVFLSNYICTILNAVKEPQGMVYAVLLVGLWLKIPCF